MHNLVDVLVRGDGLRGSIGCCEGNEEDGDEAENGCGDEEAEHPVGGGAGDFECVGDFGGEGDCVCQYVVFS